MFYRYECWKDNKYITKGIIMANSKEEAVKAIFIQYKGEYEIKNVQIIR